MTQKAKQVQLIDSGWQFRQVGQATWLPATVPGCNFTDLLSQEAIPSPFFADNESSLQWIEQESWEYQTWFSVTEEALSLKRWKLVFQGLDTYCDLYLNNRKIAESDNMFVPLSIECGEYLLPGDNHLHLVFHSPIKRTLPLHQRAGLTYPAENDKSAEKLSVFSRKAPYHFGWDWGPRFVTSGIWRPVMLVATEFAELLDVRSQTIQLDDASATLGFMVSVEGALNEHTQLEFACDNADIEVVRRPVEAGSTYVQVKINNPKLWWPNGLGEAFLYQFVVRLKQGGQVLDEIQRPVGLRTIEVVNEPDQHGECFYFKVNGHPVFMKGANYIPSDSFLNRVGVEKLEQVFVDAVDANMNMLRVWGGGVYQEDAFYDLADRYGILIWQDFMFACSLYPGDKGFLDNVEKEARANILRLRNHPSVAMWCGNNEVEMGMADWQWPEKFQYSAQDVEKLHSDYRRLFKTLLPALVEELDSERFYLSSSPIGHWEHPEQDAVGNHHYWGVWHGEQPFDEYRRRVPRFMSEFGFQSFPLIQSVRRYVPQSQWHLDSPSMQVHQKHPRGNRLIREYMLREYREPKDFASFLYLSQVQQAWGLKQAFDTHRTNMPYCMGTLYWQFNDCWPVASWSGIDYYGRWKALHYQAKRSFAPVAVFAELTDEDVQVQIVNDTLEERQLVLNWTMQSFTGTVLLQDKMTLNVGPNVSQRALEFKRDLLPQQCPVSEQVLSFELTTLSGEFLSRENLYFVANKNMLLPQPQVELHVHKGESWTLTLRSKHLVKDLFVELNGVELNLEDNFFDLLPGEVKTINIPPSVALTALSESDLVNKIRLLSVFDSYSRGKVE